MSKEEKKVFITYKLLRHKKQKLIEPVFKPDSEGDFPEKAKD